MANIYKKIFLIGGLSLVANFALAADLEVQYPELAGKALVSGSQLPSYVEYIFYAGMAIGFFSVFLSLIIAGTMYFISPAKPDLRTEAKDRAVGAISGLLILSLTYLILVTINPQLSVLKMNEPETSQEIVDAMKNPGVFFNKSGNCSDGNIIPKTDDVEDFGPALRNKINSVSMVQDTTLGIRYFSVLYDSINLQGKCQCVLTASGGCMTVEPFAVSASIFQYNGSPNGDGVYFYRKPCFDTQASGSTNSMVQYCNKNSGGYYKVPNSAINGTYVAKLDALNFTGTGGSCTVPKEEQNCTKYDEAGKCADDGRECQNLGGENISSIIINGDYIVLLVYKGLNDGGKGPWTYCQAFPTVDDVNNIGPQQVKWQSIRNNGEVIPNYVVIFPIKK